MIHFKKYMLLGEGLVHFYVRQSIWAISLSAVVCWTSTKTQIYPFQKKYITEIKVWHTVGKRRSRGAKWHTFWIGLTCLTWRDIEKGPGRGKRVAISKNDPPLLELPVHDSTWLLIILSIFGIMKMDNFPIILEVSFIHRDTKMTNQTISYLTLNTRNKLKTKKDTAFTYVCNLRLKETECASSLSRTRHRS